MSRYITATLILIALFSLIKSRFRLLNYVLSIPQMRKFVVSMTMQIPFVRDKMFSQLFQSNRP